MEEKYAVKYRRRNDILYVSGTGFLLNPGINYHTFYVGQLQVEFVLAPLFYIISSNFPICYNLYPLFLPHFYIIEIQNDDNTDHFKRVRYNEACVTTLATEPGTLFENIPTVYSLYISDFDMFKKGKTIYHIRKSVTETDQTVDDGTFEIYANVVVDDGSTIAEYLQLLKETSIDNPKFPHLTEGVKYLKNQERGVTKMSGFLAELLEKELKKELEKQLPIEVEKEVQKKLQDEVQKEVQKEVQIKLTNISISKICRMIELGYSKEDIIKLDYTNTEYALALERMSAVK